MKCPLRKKCANHNLFSRCIFEFCINRRNWEKKVGCFTDWRDDNWEAKP